MNAHIENQSNESNKESTLNIFEKLMNFWPLILILPYFLGFVYTHGKFAFISDKLLPWQLSFKSVVPVSFEHYLINGVSYLFKLLVIMPFSGILYVFFRSIRYKFFIKKLSPANYLNSIKKNEVTIFALLTCLLYFYIAFVIYSLFHKTYEYENFSILNSIFLILQLFFYILFFDYILIIKFKNNNIVSTDGIENKLNNSIFNIATVVFIFLSFSCSIYYDGLITNFLELYNLSSESNSSIEDTRVLYNNKNENYYYIEANDQFLIGYDIRNGILSMIPMSEVNKLEIFTKKMEITRDLYVSQELNPNANDCIQTIDNFYTYRKQLHFDSLKTLLTSSFNGPQEYLYPSDVLQERWKDSKETYFINYELSVPKENSVNGNYIIYVTEYWSNQNAYLEYHLTKDSGTWKINDIKESTPFKFLR